MRHHETRIFPYAAADIYQLITAIEEYPEFLPWCAAVRVLSRSEEAQMAEMVVRYKGLSERFISKVTATPPSASAPGHVEVNLVEGPFSHLFNRWELTPIPQGTRIDFTIEFTFASAMLEKLMGYFFTSAFKKMVAAFEARAKEKCSQIAKA